MSPKTFVVLSILTVVALGAAVLAPGLNQGYQPAAGAHDRLGEEGPDLLRAQRRIAAHVLNTAPAHDSGCAGGQRQAKEGRDHGDGNSRPLDLFRYRCAATVAGPSGSY